VTNDELKAAAERLRISRPTRHLGGIGSHKLADLLDELVFHRMGRQPEADLGLPSEDTWFSFDCFCSGIILDLRLENDRLGPEETLPSGFVMPCPLCCEPMRLCATYPATPSGYKPEVAQ
jgi:hypothetical protein